MKIVIDIDEKTKAEIDSLNDNFNPFKEALYGSSAISLIQNGIPLDEIVENIRNDMLDYHRVLYMDGNTKGACAVALCEYMVSKYFKESE